ncbi:hypothetical protein Dimus_013750 [Dionaea muscipula]
MAGARGSWNGGNMIQTAKISPVPPKCPFPIISPSYADYGLNSAMGSKAISRPKDGNACHQRTSSGSLLLEEQPSWLDELLTEPETPVWRGHRRSSSDSFAYIDAANLSNIEYVPISQGDSKWNPMVLSSLWGYQNFDHYYNSQKGSSLAHLNSSRRSKNRRWEVPVMSVNHLGNLVSLGNSSMPKCAGSSAGQRESDQVAEKQDQGESGLHDPKSSAENDGSISKSTSSENDTRCAKQQFAQRSRVRKLQYIAELERNVQALQAKGSEVAADLEFLNQQNLILSMENKALKQRVESMAQEQLIKCLEHEVLERKVGRLRSLYQLQQQQQPQHQRLLSSSPGRVNSRRDLDSQFANLSLILKDSTSSTDAISGCSLRI